MGINERKERQKIELRKKILLGAEEILLSQGLSKLSIRNIASKVEYSPATIYLYFDGKDEIFYELMEVGFRLLTNEIKIHFELENPVDRVKAMGKAFVEFGLANPEWFDLMFHLPVVDIEKFIADSSPGLILFNLVIKTCETLQKEFPHIQEPPILALILLSNVVGLVNLLHCNHIKFIMHIDNNLIIQQHIDTFLGLLFKRNKNCS